jgi:hypothetical protein
VRESWAFLLSNEAMAGREFRGASPTPGGFLARRNSFRSHDSRGIAGDAALRPPEAGAGRTPATRHSACRVCRQHRDRRGRRAEEFRIRDAGSQNPGCRISTTRRRIGVPLPTGLRPRVIHRLVDPPHPGQDNPLGCSSSMSLRSQAASSRKSIRGKSGRVQATETCEVIHGEFRSMSPADESQPDTDSKVTAIRGAPQVFVGHDRTSNQGSRIGTSNQGSRIRDPLGRIPAPSDPRRHPFGPVGGGLVGGPGAEQDRLVPGAADQLQADRQARGREPAGDRERRLAGQV